MDEASILWILILALFALCIILLFHHAYIHGPQGTSNRLTGEDQWFQISDVGNFHSCSHEMWIIGIGTVAVILLTYNLVFHVF